MTQEVVPLSSLSINHVLKAASDIGFFSPKSGNRALWYLHLNILYVWQFVTQMLCVIRKAATCVK